MCLTKRLRAIAASAVIATVALAAPAASAMCGIGWQGWHGSWGGGGNWDGSRWGYWDNGVFINAGWPHFGYYDSYEDCLGADDNDGDRYVGYSYYCDPNSPNYNANYCMGK